MQPINPAGRKIICLPCFLWATGGQKFLIFQLCMAACKISNPIEHFFLKCPANYNIVRDEGGVPIHFLLFFQILFLSVNYCLMKTLGQPLLGRSEIMPLIAATTFSMQCPRAVTIFKMNPQLKKHIN